MKKLFALISFAAILFVGCNKKESSISLPLAPNKDNHTTIRFSDENPPVQNPDGNSDKLVWAAISSGVKGVAGFKTYDKAVEFDYQIATRVSAGTCYRIKHVGDFVIESIEGDVIKFKFYPEGSSAFINLEGTFDDEPYADNALCRDWTVEETIITVKGDGISADLGVAKSFKPGCDIAAISRYLREKGVNIDEQDEARNVTGITLFETGKFAIFFKGIEPYYGDFSLGSDGKFTYDFKFYDNDDPIIAGNAEGSFTLVKGPKGRLEITGTMKDNDDKAYSATLIFVLQPSA